MKFIIKGDEPESFTDWKNLENEDWKPSYDKLSGKEKKDVKNALIKEQAGLCCYCERELAYDDSHIEHLNPQCNSEEERLDFKNMLCSCQKQLKKGEPLHCGNSKSSKVLQIIPLNNSCEQHFTYTEDGFIGYQNDIEKDTIETLKLDIDKLNNLRASVIEPFIIDPITYEEVSLEEAEIFAKEYLKQKNGRYNEFYTTIKYLFG